MHAPRFRWHVALALAVLGAGTAVRSAPPQADRKPADLISVDFLAVAEDGRPVANLKKEDLSFKLDGKLREIRSLQYVPLDAEPRGEVVPRWRPLPPPFGTNVLAEAGRVVMIVVEHESIRPGKERPALEAVETAGTLELSGLALGVASGGSFTPKLQFGSDPSAIAFLEIYGDAAKAMGVSVTLEIANSVDGPALVAAPAPTQQTQEDDRRMAIGTIPLGGLEPGDYLVRAVVTSDGKPLGRVYRTLRKGR